MADKNVASIVIVDLPKKLTYFTGGEKIDPQGGQICAIYDDGSFRTMPMDENGVELSYKAEKEGSALATVTYGGQSQMFQVYVREPVVRKFLMSRPPAKKEYLAGEKLDLTGMKLLAEYETGERAPFQEIPPVDHTVQYGEAVYPLTINGISIPIYIKVADATLTGIRMGKLPARTEYLERRDKFDPAGATIIQMFDSGSEKEVPLPYSAVRGFSNLEPGSLTLTVQVGQFSTSFEVTILEKSPVKVTIDTPPFRTSYTEGEPIEMDGIRVSVGYDNGETRISDDWDYTPREAVLGQQFVAVTVGDVAASLPITVAPRQLMGIKVCKLPDKTQYKERLEQLDVAGAELELDYDYGDPVVIPIESHMVKGFDNRRAGECRVEVQYQGLAAEFPVDILPQMLLGIIVTQMPERLDYAPGEAFDPKGLAVSGFYDGGVMDPLRSYAISPDRPLEQGDVAILISSMDKTAVIPIKVAEMFRAKPEEPLEWEAPIPEPEPPTREPFVTVPAEDASSLFGAPPRQEPEEEPRKKGGAGFWGRKLFPPNTSRYRGDD